MNSTLGSLVAARPALGPVFEALGIDYCCGGHRTLEQAAREKGLDPQTLALTISALPLSPAPDADASRPTAPNPAELDTPALLDHIVAVHHAFVRRELPRLVELSARADQAHGPQHPELQEIRTGVQRLSYALLSHLEAEEKDLFPLLRNRAPEALKTARASLAPYFEEHEEAGALLARFRELTNSFAHPAWACATYRSLVDRLKAFEADLHQHVHLENNVLFERLP